jgi:mannose-6-phosphate isomerase-like protein (cupin superfamily)
MDHGNLAALTLRNKAYRKVIFTNTKQQIVLMNLQPRQEIGMEVHPHTSQFIRIEGGSGHAVVDGKRYNLKHDSFVIVSPGSKHNVVAGRSGLQLYTIYSPPEHPPGLVEEDSSDSSEDSSGDSSS